MPKSNKDNHNRKHVISMIEQRRQYHVARSLNVDEEGEFHHF